ncbi:serine hydrolase FSH [Xylariomycetidae sp. FL2044]|nr:serine hydrolase FSH [Xylariomycetidae sp. FL2044]
MRVLCLHGQNSSARAFESDLAPITSQVTQSDAAHEFIFIDGPIPSTDPSDDGSPRFIYPETSTTTTITSSNSIPDVQHKWLTTELETNGPYDGVLAFAEGAAVVSSYLLHHQWYDEPASSSSSSSPSSSPTPTPPIKFAIFLGGQLPLGVLGDLLGAPAPAAARRVVAEARRQHRLGLGPLAAHVAVARRAAFDSDDCFGLNLNRIPPELKIRIPTLHAWGERDPLLPGAVHLAGLCDPYLRKIYVHPGAREVVPSSSLGGREEEEEDDAVVVVEEMAGLIRWCIRCATWPGQTRD